MGKNISLLDAVAGSDYDLCLEAWGDGLLCDEALSDFMKPDTILNRFQKRHRRYPRDISLLLKDSRGFGSDIGYTGVHPAFLENLKTLKELILPDSVTDIGLTPALAAMLKENDVLIRGAFDSFAEKLAVELGLHFRPADFVFAETFFEPAQESTVLHLLFARDGSVQIEEKCSSPGSSAGNTFGGSFYYPLPRDFYITMTAEQFASQLRPSLCDATLKDGRLASFLEKAKAHGYYTGKN